jgi:starvation-inducible outer membrane lipoprotein
MLTLTGCVAAPLAIKMTKATSEKTLGTLLGGAVTILGALVIIEAVTLS